MSTNAGAVLASLEALGADRNVSRTPAKPGWFWRYAASAATVYAAIASFALIAGARTAVASAGPIPAHIDGVALCVYGCFTLLFALLPLVVGVPMSLALAVPIATLLNSPSIRHRRFSALLFAAGTIMLACIAASVGPASTHALDDLH